MLRSHCIGRIAKEGDRTPMSSKQKDSAPKTVCIRQKQNFGLVTGIPTQRQRLLQPWEEIEIFYGDADELFAALISTQAEANAAREAEKSARREAARAREVKRVPPVLSKIDLLNLRPDPELMEKAKDGPPISEVCTSAYMKHDPEFFTTQLFNDEDLVDVVHAYGSGSTKRFGDIKNNLAAYSTINVNPLTRGKVPTRKRVAVRFETSYWKRLSFLTRAAAEMQMLMCGASGGLFAIFDCERWSQKKLAEFATLAVKLGGELVEQIPMPGAPAGSLNGMTYKFLYSGGFVRDRMQYTPRQFVLYWRVPNKSLPTVPPKGRRA
jgi:hypothetical protein